MKYIPYWVFVTIVILSGLYKIVPRDDSKMHNKPLIEARKDADGSERYRFVYMDGTVKCYYKPPQTDKLIEMNCTGYK